MPPISVVLAHEDAALVQSLTGWSNNQFLNLASVNTAVGVREVVARLRAQLVIVDLEVVSFQELGELCREFPSTAFVCTHRLADDVMWSQSLAAGAVDCCLAGDIPRILEASESYVAIKQVQTVSAA